MKHTLSSMMNRPGRVRNPERIPPIMSALRAGWSRQPELTIPEITQRLRIGYLTEDTVTYRRLSRNKLSVDLWVPEKTGTANAGVIIDSMEDGVDSVHLPLDNYLREGGDRRIDLTMSALEMSWVACWTWRFGELIDNLGTVLGADLFEDPERLLRASEIAWHGMVRGG